MQRLFVVLSVLCFGFSQAFAVDQKPAFEPVVTKLIVPATKAQTLKVDLNGAFDLYLVADYGKDSYDSDQAIWAEPVLYDAEGKIVRLTELKPVSVKVGWGNLFVDKNHANSQLSIANESFKFGFFAHAPSILHFKLDGKYKRFETKVGLDRGSQRGSVVFQVRSTPATFPSVAEYTKNYSKAAPQKTLIATPADNAEFQFNTEAAKKLINCGIGELLFIRRFTYTSNHVYTDYVNSRWLPGGGICAVNLKTGKVREIVPELTRNAVVGWFDLSFDAKKIVFDLKKSNDEGYRIYEVNVDGSGLRQLTFPLPNESELISKFRNGYHHGTDDVDPCYLPDGGIVFASTRCQFSVLCDSGDGFTVKNIYRMNADGTNIKQLTYSPLSEATPTVHHDGRILYHRWEYVDKAAGNCKSIWSMNPDGSGTSEVYGNTITFPETKIQARAIPGEPNKIVMLGSSHWINNAVGTVVLVDTSKNIRSTAAMKYITDDVAAFAHDGFHFKDKNGQWFRDGSGKSGRVFREPYPVSSNLFIASMKPAGKNWSDPSGYYLVLLDELGRETRLLCDPSISLWHAYPLVSREVPPVLSGVSIDSELAAKGLARCVVTDIYVGMDNVKRGEVKYLRILEQLPRHWEARKRYRGDSHGMAHSAIGDGLLSPKVQHGIVPVEDDGSAQFLVPAGRAIYFQALDKNLCAIQTERTYVNYTAGETRSCVGCHETPDMTPPKFSGTLKSMLRPASIPAPQPTQNKAEVAFDFDRQIQPVLDKHCVSCHQGATDKTQQKNANSPQVNVKTPLFDLRGTHQGTFSVAYNNLVKLGHAKQLLGNRRELNENADSNRIEYISPYRTGALSSPLAAMIFGWGKTTLENKAVNEYAAKLQAIHENLRLSQGEKLVITNWLDVNCQFHPSYWGKKNAQYKNEPDYRPIYSFEEIRNNKLPKR
ncbi:MAG: NPCBM/NEW2 domain-containing protein [Planctomycetaceae bacterium]|jgi:hypothetical protein|nr:NPCBM/NEW2 domain-containing protein [Planctomycetaceae bacterium]